MSADPVVEVMLDSEPRVAVLAKVVGAFYVHQGLREDGWTITHPLTGRAAGYGFPRRAAAKGAARKLSALSIDWKGDIPTLPVADRRRCLTIIEAFGGQGMSAPALSPPTREEIAVLLGERLQSIVLLHGLIREYASPEDYLVLAQQAHRKLAGLTLELGRLLGAGELYPVPGSALERAIARRSA